MKELSKYPIEYFDEYFVNWGEVCAAARTTGMSDVPSDYEKKKDKMIQHSFDFDNRAAL